MPCFKVNHDSSETKHMFIIFMSYRHKHADLRGDKLKIPDSLTPAANL